MAVRRRAAAAVVILLAASVVWVGMAPRPAPAAVRPPMTGDGPATAQPDQLPTETVPLLGDFDGDGRADLLWYGPGAKDDHLWLGRPSRNFVGSPVTVRGNYLPLVGDYDGDGRGDVLWYGPGAEPDVLWLGRPGGRFSARTLSVRGTYRPLLGDFNGDRRRDVLWYGPGAASDVVWYGRPGGRFSARTLSVRGTYQPLVGDFNGDGPRDVVWYRPEGGTDVVWFGHGNGRFTARAVGAPDDTRPFTGDFDGDGRRDIFWYRPGAAADGLWYGSPSGRFGVRGATARGVYEPLVADVGGDGPDDVLWWAPGPPNDVLWFGRPTRRFTSRSTTVDLGYARAAAISPQTLAARYDPYGFVAHAFGLIEGHAYSNSLEAFQRNYARGYRVFECDNVLLADGTVLVAHDSLEANYGLSKPFSEATWADLAGHKYLGRYTILRSDDVLRLLVEHPDVYMIPDPKYARPAIYRAYVRAATRMGRLDLLERIMPHVADQAELDALRVYYPLQNYVLALYHSQAKNRYDDAAAIDFVRRNRTPAVMMWWKDRDPSISLAANGRQSRRYRRSFADGLRAAGAVTYVHSLLDPAAIQRFWDLGIGVYSDEPFPPLDRSIPEVKVPSFRSRDATPPA